MNFFDVIDVPFDNPILYIIGPTAIGKSDLALSLAQKHGAEIISADSYQVYQGMDIGTAKVSKEDQQKVPHHLIDIHTPDQSYSVMDFIHYCNKQIKANKPMIICGGNGLFLRSFLYQYNFPKAESDPQVRESLMTAYAQNKDALWEQLNSIDPDSASRIHVNNVHQLVRALEIYTITKKAPSQIKQQHASPREDVTIVGLTCDRNVVIDRINARVDAMISNGLIEEAQGLLSAGYSPTLPALKCIGYQEAFEYIHGRISLDEMIELIKIHTRQFSKRQMTWFKKIDNVFWNILYK